MDFLKRYTWELSFLRKFWKVWKRFGQFIGDIVGRVVLTIFYFTIFLPFGLGVRLFGDHLDTKRKIDPSWRKRTADEATLEQARRLA